MCSQRVRLSLGRAMVVIAAIGGLLGGLRVMFVYVPHVRRCWELAEREERIRRTCLQAAADYQKCAQAVPCSPSEYCYNACITHVARQSATDEQRAEAADAHRRAVEDFREAAERHGSMALRYRQAAFRWSRPLPIPVPEQYVDLLWKYRCDML